ncbi:hypothetical protein GCM10028784_29820 [Myceligenerans cantabricum]
MPPPKLRRRRWLTGAAILAFAVGGGLGAVAWTTASTSDQVLVAAQGIERGEQITASDLTRASLNPDPSVATIPAGQLQDVVGQRAAVSIPAGSLLAPGAVTSDLVPSAGRAVVGVVLPAPVAPGTALHPGDEVRVIVTPSGGEGEPALHEASVVAVHADPTGQAGVVVDVELPELEATALATDLATGTATVVLGSREAS